MIRSLILVPLVTIAAWGAEPVKLDLQTFDQGLPANGWRAHAWSRTLDGSPVTAIDQESGKVIKIGSVDAGAAGVVSRVFVIDPADKGWRVTLRLKAEGGYAGNTPWLFVACVDQAGAFLPPAVNLTPSAKAGAAWSEAVAEVTRDKLPAGAAKLSFNFASAAIKGQSPAGALLIDDVRIEALR